MSWVDINPPAKAGRGEYITVATWKRGGLGVTLSPDLAKRLGVDKGTKARLAHNPETGQLRVTLDTAGKHEFCRLKGAAVIRFGTVRGLVVNPGKHLVDWTEQNTADGLALILDSLGHKPKAATDEMERAPVAPARTVLLSDAGGAKPSPQPQPRHASLAPRDARGNPVSRANDPRYQVPR